MNNEIDFLTWDYQKHRVHNFSSWVKGNFIIEHLIFFELIERLGCRENWILIIYFLKISKRSVKYYDKIYFSLRSQASKQLFWVYLYLFN